MRNIAYLVLAVLFFAAAYYIYWLVAQENETAGQVATRGVRRPGGPQASGLIAYIKQYQPYLTLASSLGGIASFLFQVRVWMRGRS